MDITKDKHKGNAESVAAFENTPVSARQKQYNEVNDFIITQEEHGSITDEVVSLLDLPHQSVSARMSELKRDGKIIWNGEYRNTRLGNRAKVFVAA